MQDTQENTNAAPETGEKPAEKKKQPALRSQGSFSIKIFNLILRYKESKFFVWVHKNYVLSLVIVTMWGMLLVGAFLFFVIAQVLRQNAGQ